MSVTIPQRLSSLALATSIGLLPFGLASASDNLSHGQKLEGTWLIKVTLGVPPPGQPAGFLSMVTFTPTGQFFEENNTGSVRSVGHGEWIRVGNRHFIRRSLIFRYDAQRTFLGITKGIFDVRLNRRGDRSTHVASVENYDVEGNLVSTAQNTGDGRRCGIAASIQECLAFRE